MHEKDMYTAVPNGNSYAAMQAFLERRLGGAGVSLRVQNRVQVAADEIWSNIVHYSGASQASLELRWEEETLFLRFTDDGKPVIAPMGQPSGAIIESIGENLNVMTLGDGTVIYFDNFGNIVNP